MFKVTFSFEDGSVVETFANAGDNLLEVARSANVAIDAPCSGNGACGKCRVQLKSGELESKKTLHISDEEYQAGWRLSCCSKICADVNVLVPDIASAYKSRMKVADLSSKEEIAIFENAKRDVELAGIELKNSLEVVDVTMDSMVIELTGHQDKLDAFLDLLQEYEILELARTGITGLTRGSDDVIFLD